MTPRNWRKIKDRLAEMDGAELRDRIRQELAKRQDGLFSHVGYNFSEGPRYPNRAGAGKFFFGADSVPEILTLLQQRIPGRTEEIIKQADKICRHRFDLLGYEDLEYGSPIDWHLDAVHGKRAPRKLFYKIRYLDFAEVGDNKVTWELNRHQHLVTLAKAYRIAGEPRYADEALRQYRHWRADNPYPLGINWVSSLEVAFRSLSWLWTYHLLNGSPGVPDLRGEWLHGLALHGRYIERYLSTYFSPNTHLLGEGVALFFLGVLCPELAAAERWKELGWKIVLQEAARQVRDDGFHFEQSTYYHVYALDFFLHSAILASVNGIPTPRSFEETIEKMLTALHLLGRGGAPPRFGDDDGGRLFDGRRNGGGHLLDPLATGAILFHRGDFKTAAGALREETLWLLGAEGVRQWDQLEASSVSTESAALGDAGFYLLPSAPTTQLVVDAGPLGTQSGGHGHADALSVSLQSDGRGLLIDPGTFEYVGSDNDRDYFRGTAMHNTVRVDGKNQAEPGTPFSWQRLTKAKVERWIQGKNFDLLVASHDGYQRLEPPVNHQRWVLSLRNGMYLVRDVVSGKGRHRLDIAWHLGQDLQLLEAGLFRAKGASQGLMLLPTQGHDWAEEVSRESWSPAYGRKAAMTTMNFGTETELPAEFAIMLVTLEEAHRGSGAFTRLESAGVQPDVHGYRYAGEKSEYSFVFGQRGKSWRLGSISSDAEFVCLHRESGDEHLIVCGGSYARLDGGAEVRCSRSVEWAESVGKAGARDVFSSDMAAVEVNSTELPASNPASLSPGQSLERSSE
jgi:hypothetical protein